MHNLQPNIFILTHLLSGFWPLQTYLLLVENLNFFPKNVLKHDLNGQAGLLFKILD